MVLDSFFNLIFGWSINISPLFGIGVVAFIFTLIVTLIYKYTTDQSFMKSVKEEMKDLQKQMKEHKEDHKKVMELQKVVMEKNMKYMMHSFKPMLFTFIPVILVFGWLRTAYTDMGPVLFGLSWIWGYIIFSMIFSIALRKILKVH